MSLTPQLKETLVLLAQGYTDKAISRQLHISTRGIQNRIQTLAEKLGVFTIMDASSVDGPYETYNVRTLLVSRALQIGELTLKDLRSGDSPINKKEKMVQVLVRALYEVLPQVLETAN